MDAARERAPWYWYLIILIFPLMRSMVYFAVSRSSRFDAFGSEVSRRGQARKRLRALAVQLSHWRSHLTNMLTMVEWRLLRRDEAMLLGLPDYFREDLVQVRATLESYQAYTDEPTAGDVFVDSDWEKDYQRQISRSRAKYDELGRQAGENVEPSDATTVLFDTHRDELAAFEPDGLQYWIKAMDDSLPWP